GETVVRLELAVGRIDDCFERGQLRIDARLSSVGILIRKLQLIGRVNLDIDLYCLDRRPREAQRIRAVTPFGQCLYLQSAAERIRVVLKRDNAQHRRGVGIDQYDPALKESG